MFLLIFLFLILLLGLGILWFVWRNKHWLIGTENRQKFFASDFKGDTIFYNKQLLPVSKKLFKSIEDLRKPGKELRILEIGAGPGANFQFYPKNTKLTVVDPNPFFKEKLIKNLKKVTLDRYVVTGAENMKVIDDNSFDAVVSTLVLCSCDQLQQVFKEIGRVLTPGGKYLFMEHVIDDKPLSFVKFLQVFLCRLGIFPLFNDGCRCDKDLEKEIKKSGVFANVELERFRLALENVYPRALVVPYSLIAPHLYGTATAP